MLIIIIDLNGTDFRLDLLSRSQARPNFLIEDVRQDCWFLLWRVGGVQSLHVGCLDTVIAVWFQTFSDNF